MILAETSAWVEYDPAPRGLIDCMVAAVATRTRASLLAAEADFARMTGAMGLVLDEATPTSLTASLYVIGLDHRVRECGRRSDGRRRRLSSASSDGCADQMSRSTRSKDRPRAMDRPGERGLPLKTGARIS